MTLADKIQDKRDKAKQKATDGKQDVQVQALREQVNKLSNEQKEPRSRRGSRSRSRSTCRRRRRDDSDDEETEVATNARRSRAMIERMYKDNVDRMGQQYATGDLMTENKLQAQIIQLQQTVISVLQDALYNGRDLSQSDMRRLVAAQNAAREGSLDALEGRTRRMLAQKPTSSRMSLDYGRSHADELDVDFAPPRRQLTLPERPIPQRSYSPVKRSRTLPLDTGSIFCRYSEQLQYSSRALDPAFDPSGDGRCSQCSTVLPIIHEAIVSLEGCEYRVSQRFFVKSHTPDGRFACVLCSKHRDVDCICRDVTALAKHLASTHAAEEAEQDVDLTEARDTSVRSRQRQLEYV
ncbi:hypothetical protein LTS10_010818 [Elasticomyces elasticus]|nr:hypothetical protein LTS10_010818 [Elasticomyces elasticus]